jgi:hypothetical protein
MTVQVTPEQRRRIVAAARGLRAAGAYRKKSDPEFAEWFMTAALVAGAELLASEGPG